MLKAYKYRLYPNEGQRIQIAKTFGCCRFVYNQILAHRKNTYEQEKKSLSRTECNNYCNRELKAQYEWLKEVDFENNRAKLPKLTWVKAKLHRKFDGHIKSAAISQTPSGKYFVSFLVETSHEITGRECILSDILEDAVDEKYFLSREQMEKIVFP